MCVREKNAQCERCELSSVWDRMRAVAHETASQTSLRNSLEKIEGRSVSVCFGQKGDTGTSAHIWQSLAAGHKKTVASHCLHY